MAKAIGLTNKEITSMKREGINFLKKIGEGTFATVVLVEHYESSHFKPLLLACKVFDKEKAPTDFVDDFFRRELEIIVKLKNPHIIHIHSIVKHRSKLYIFMRHAENGDLMDYLRDHGPASEEQTKLWFTQISSGLQYLHDQDIAHRDLKCENILLTRNYNAKLTDFGFARYIADEDVTETFCGSQPYVAPEIISGKPYHPKCSDVWALGVVLFVMLDTQFPFECSHSSMSKQYQKQIQEDWRFRPETHDKISYEGRAMVSYILNTDPNKRPTISRVLCHNWVNSR